MDLLLNLETNDVEQFILFFAKNFATNSKFVHKMPSIVANRLSIRLQKNLTFEFFDGEIR